MLYRVPGSLLVRGAVGGFPGLGGETRPEPSLVETDDGWAFALLVERGPPGFCTDFLPGDSPTPTSRVRTHRRRHAGAAPRRAPMLDLLAWPWTRSAARGGGARPGGPWPTGA